MCNASVVGGDGNTLKVACPLQHANGSAERKRIHTDGAVDRRYADDC
ncbi:MAG: hypothetical protein IPL52_11345 [Flavobacteriales bacterium]|nr:hypothetical protein [Flavobacteriales bacterium]